jgi:predicted secreted protein
MLSRIGRIGLPTLMLVGGLALSTAQAQDRPLLDILNVESSVNSEVTPDLAVVTLSVMREGADSAALSQEVEATLARALAEAKTVPGIQAATGGFNTSPHLDSKGQRINWQIRADLMLKSKEFANLGKMVGKLSSGANALLIAGSTFEVSPELKQSEENNLIERAIAAFKAKAGQATKALGYASYAIREITLGEVTSSGSPRAMLLNAGSSLAPTLALDAPRVTLQLHVQGSVQMRH